MSLCKNCGVELDTNAKICPLCGHDPEQIANNEPAVRNSPSEILALQKKETISHLWEITGIIAFSGIAVCTIVDLVIGRGLKWSPIADASILAEWIILTLFLKAFRKPFILIPGLFVTIITLLFIIDFSVSGLKWFFPIGLPLTVAVFASIAIILIIWHIANLKGFNILSVFFLVASGFCIITELIIDKYLFGTAELRWSLIASVSIFPFAIIFIFFHYRMKKGKQLDSFFHI